MGEGVEAVGRERPDERMSVEEVDLDDVVAVASDVLRHRLVLRPVALSERFGANDANTMVIREVLLAR